MSATPAGFGPYIPCALCGMALKYTLAVARVIDAEECFVGFTHPVGDCRPSDIAAWQVQIGVIAERNDARARREGQERAAGR